MTLHRPESLDAALALLAMTGASVVAGGTDLYPALRDAPPPQDMIDLTRVVGLRGISRTREGWRIGATTTWNDVVRADLPPLFDGLKQAAREVGSIQIQNAGTIAGNLCNASPAADGIPPLLTLDAEVELAGADGARRRLPLAGFVLGPRRTALAPGELLTAVHIASSPGRGAFLKLGARRYLVISIAMTAATVAFEDGRIRHARLSVGACAPVAFRLPALEAALVGAEPGAVPSIVAASPLPGLAPIDDVRASAAYRAEAVRTLLARTISLALEGSHVA